MKILDLSMSFMYGFVGCVLFVMYVFIFNICRLIPKNRVTK